MQEGWKCPVCGRGVSPWISVCPCWEEKKVKSYQSSNKPSTVKQPIKSKKPFCCEGCEL